MRALAEGAPQGRTVELPGVAAAIMPAAPERDRKSTRLNSSH